MAISGTIYKDYAQGIRIDEETSYATGAVEADAISLGQVTSFSTTLTDGVLRLLGIGEGRNETQSVYGPVNITGSVEWTVLADNATTAGGSCAFLRFAVGKIQGSGTTAAPYEIVEVDAIDYSSMYSFGIYAQNEAGTTDDVDLYAGCVANSITLNFAVDQTLKASMDFTAQKVTSSTSITTQYVANTAKPFTFQQGTFKWGATPSTVSGVQSGSITMNNSPQIYRSIEASRFIEKPEFGRRLYDFNITAKMTSVIATTLRDNFYGQANSFIAGKDPATTTADYEIALNFAEGSASGDKTLTVELDQCTLLSMSKPIPVGQGIVEVTFTGFAKSGKPDSTDNVFMRFHQVSA